MNKATTVDGRTVTARDLQAWLSQLPEEWKDVPVEAVFGSLPVTLKRIVAYKSKDGSCRGIVVNGMGTHLPFDDSLEWVFSLS